MSMTSKAAIDVRTLGWQYPGMPLPKALARFNRSVTNPLVGGLAQRLPGFAVVTHRGRRSNRPYETVVNIFPDDDRFVIALTYGRDSDWVKNVRAAGEAMVSYRGKNIDVERPILATLPGVDDTLPLPVRLILRFLSVDEVMILHRRRDF